MTPPAISTADVDALEPGTAAACAREGRWSCPVTVAPLIVIGGTASPVNPSTVL